MKNLLIGLMIMGTSFGCSTMTPVMNSSDVVAVRVGRIGVSDEIETQAIEGEYRMQSFENGLTPTASFGRIDEQDSTVEMLGLRYETLMNPSIVLGFGAQAGLVDQRSDSELEPVGGHLQFRGIVDLNYIVNEHFRLGVGYGQMSNLGISQDHVDSGLMFVTSSYSL